MQRKRGVVAASFPVSGNSVDDGQRRALRFNVGKEDPVYENQAAVEQHEPEHFREQQGNGG